MSAYQSLKEEACEANRTLGRSGLVNLTFGNASVADRRRGVLAIKPSGVDYARLKPRDMVVVDFAGKIVEGRLRPSSDTPTHRCLMIAFREIASVVHTHSRHAVAFAQAGRPLPCLGTTHADHFRAEVPVTRRLTAREIGPDYEWETGKVIVERFRRISPLEVPAVLVRGHGPFVWAATAPEALENALALEICAEMACWTLALNPRARLEAGLRERHFLRKHGKNASYGQKKARP